jgi:hemerythrin superfamily protein
MYYTVPPLAYAYREERSMAAIDAISMLKQDHKSVERLFKRFEMAGDRAHVDKRAIVDRIIEELSMHAAIEEQLFYPVVRSTVPGSEDITLESLEEHHIVKWVLSELESMKPEDERFVAKVTVLIESVRHHVEEEEKELFPMVRGALGRKALNELGEAMAAAKKFAPTHPHPRSPDMPPGNLVVGTAAGVADRIGDTMSGLAQGGVTAVADIVATVLRRKKPQVSPRGSKVTRTTAGHVRSSASDATESVVDAIRSAKRTDNGTARRARTTGSSASASATRTARAAKRGSTGTARAAKAAVKGTTTSARTSTNRAVATAKRGATTSARTARKSVKRTATTAKRPVSQRASTDRKSVNRTAATAKRSASAR